MERLNAKKGQYCGKSAVAYGDSITYGIYNENGNKEALYVNRRWCDIVSERLGFASLTNYAQSGISISSTSSVLSERALSKCYNEMRDDAEIVLIAGGTNDFGTDVILGTNTDREDISFCGALHILCRGLKEKYPEATVVFITPVDRKDSNANKLGLSLDDYRQKIKEIAGGIYGFVIVDGECAGFDAKNPEFCAKYMNDGVHPNPEAHVLYGEAVANALLAK